MLPLNLIITFYATRYPCKHFLMTPFLATESDDSVRHQQTHTKTGVTVERAFGQFKRRFHVLHSEVINHSNRFLVNVLLILLPHYT